MAELVGNYADLPLGAVDASVLAVAERLGATEIDQLLTRFTAFALDGPIRRVRTNKHAGVAQMRVSFERRSR
jgi:hypothetical protein